MLRASAGFAPPSGSSRSISAGTTMSSTPASTARAIASASSSDASGMSLGPCGLRLLDDLLRDVPGDLLVVGELELEVPAPARHRAEVGRVAEHLRHRHVGADHLLTVAARLGAQHLAAPAVQVADHVAHVVVG